MISKRGNTYQFSSTVGGRRFRASLGTSDKGVAKSVAARVSCALRDGEWARLREVLPPATYRSLAKNAPPDLTEFARRFRDHLAQREKLGEIAASSHSGYRTEADKFFAWLPPSFRLLENITPSVIQKYRAERQAEIAAGPRYKNGRGLITVTVVLRMVFKFAVEEGYLRSSPVKSGFTNYGEAKGAEPFLPWEMERLNRYADSGTPQLVHLLLKWTGLRGSDAAAVTWDAVSLGGGVLTWKTKKRGKTVTVPLADELLKLLIARYDLLQPDLDEPVLGYGMTRPKLYSIIRKLGDQAEVKNVHPHRYRDNLACFLLERGGTIYDVAKVLGDTVATVEKHYAPFTDRLQDRVRKILDSEA